MSLVEYARDELARLVKEDDDGTQVIINRDILAIVELFAEQGHSGSTAGYSIGILTRLLAYQPLGPLTGAPDEWSALEYDEDMWAQNKRCSHVFMRRDGTAYDIEAVVFREPSGATFTGRGSARDVAFPYTPVREYQDVSVSDEELLLDQEFEDRVFNRVMAEVDAEEQGNFFKGIAIAVVLTALTIAAGFIAWRLTWAR